MKIYLIGALLFVLAAVIDFGIEGVLLAGPPSLISWGIMFGFALWGILGGIALVASL